MEGTTMKEMKKGFLPNRRQVLKAGLAAGIGMAIPWRFLPARVFAATQGPGLSDPANQLKFNEIVPNALDPGFIYNTKPGHKIKVGVGQTMHMTGLVATNGVTPIPTTVWGYGDNGFYTWPSQNFPGAKQRTAESEMGKRIA